MIESISNPEPSALESAVEAAEPDLQFDGTVGTAPDGPTLAERHLIVAGWRPQSALESVIGVDDRTRILETDRTPWRMICALLIAGTNGARFIGTAWFAGPRTLITAGHCVHHPDLGGWARSIEVSPGRNGDVRAFKPVVARRFSSVASWVNGQQQDFDVGCIHLEEDLGTQVGAFGVSALPANDLIGRRVNISGYPLTPGSGTQQWFHSNAVQRITSRRIFYDVDTSGGQSGAPVWVQDDGADKTPRVVAIHAYGVDQTSPDANSAPLIDADVFEVIRGWVTNGPS